MKNTTTKLCTVPATEVGPLGTGVGVVGVVGGATGSGGISP